MTKRHIPVFRLCDSVVGRGRDENPTGSRWGARAPWEGSRRCQHSVTLKGLPGLFPEEPQHSSGQSMASFAVRAGEARLAPGSVNCNLGDLLSHFPLGISWLSLHLWF